jgi:hypothetical protein
VFEIPPVVLILVFQQLIFSSEQSFPAGLQQFFFRWISSADTRTLIHLGLPPRSWSSSSFAGISARFDEEVVLLASSMPKRRTGRKKFKETRQPIYRGVRRRKRHKWVSEMCKPNEKTGIWLGTYPSVEMAAQAHDVAALALRGTSACLNLADLVWSVHLPASTDAGEIRRAWTGRMTWKAQVGFLYGASQYKRCRQLCGGRLGGLVFTGSADGSIKVWRREGSGKATQHSFS